MRGGLSELTQRKEINTSTCNASQGGKKHAHTHCLKLIQCCKSEPAGPASYSRLPYEKESICCSQKCTLEFRCAEAPSFITPVQHYDAARGEMEFCK